MVQDYQSTIHHRTVSNGHHQRQRQRLHPLEGHCPQIDSAFAPFHKVSSVDAS
jgi:hypothetical protein